MILQRRVRVRQLGETFESNLGGALINLLAEAESLAQINEAPFNTFFVLFPSCYDGPE